MTIERVALPRRLRFIPIFLDVTDKRCDRAAGVVTEAVKALR